MFVVHTTLDIDCFWINVNLQGNKIGLEQIR